MIFSITHLCFFILTLAKTFSFQDLNFIGVSLSCRNLALVTRNPFQLLKGLFPGVKLSLVNKLQG